MKLSNLPVFVGLVAGFAAIFIASTAGAVERSELEKSSIKAATDCVAAAALSNPNITTFYREDRLKKVTDWIVLKSDACDNPLRAMRLLHDRLYGEGTGRTFIRGAYLADLPRAVGERIRGKVAERSVESPDVRDSYAWANLGQLSAGTKLMVVNVTANDVLSIREYPTENSPVIDIIRPDATGVVYLVETEGQWIFVSYDRAKGWVSRRFVVPMTSRAIKHEGGYHMKSHRALAIGICSILASFDISTARAASSLWDHNGSTVYLVAHGATREFHYNEPRPGMLEAGVRPGSLLFTGESIDGRYVGTAYFFNPNCGGQFPYQVSGPILDNYKRVVLKGQAPRIDDNCNIMSYFTDTLEFSFLKSIKTTPDVSDGYMPLPARELNKGAELTVVNVGANDAVVMREAPTENSPIIDMMPPNSKGVFYLGEAQGQWVFVRYENRAEGWVNRRFVEPIIIISPGRRLQ
jgi:SH3-like domain-containing protein